jgi:hypothetical protein
MLGAVLDLLVRLRLAWRVLRGRPVAYGVTWNQPVRFDPPIGWKFSGCTVTSGVYGFNFPRTAATDVPDEAA